MPQSQYLEIVSQTAIIVHAVLRKESSIIFWIVWFLDSKAATPGLEMVIPNH